MENNDSLKKAKEEYDKIAADEYERRLADLRLKYVLDMNAVKDDGYEDGYETAKKETQEQIERINKEKEKEINEEKLRIAKELFKNGMSKEKIHEITGLSEEEIRK